MVKLVGWSGLTHAKIIYVYIYIKIFKIIIYIIIKDIYIKDNKLKDIWPILGK